MNYSVLYRKLLFIKLVGFEEERKKIIMNLIRVNVCELGEIILFKEKYSTTDVTYTCKFFLMNKPDGVYNIEINMINDKLMAKILLRGKEISYLGNHNNILRSCLSDIEVRIFNSLNDFDVDSMNSKDRQNWYNATKNKITKDNMFPSDDFDMIIKFEEFIRLCNRNYS